MCIKTIFNDSTGVSYVCGGFEDGSVVIWDERQTDKVYTFGSLFSDPSKYFSHMIMFVLISLLVVTEVNCNYGHMRMQSNDSSCDTKYLHNT